MRLVAHACFLSYRHVSAVKFYSLVLILNFPGFTNHPVSMQLSEVINMTMEERYKIRCSYDRLKSCSSKLLAGIRWCTQFFSERSKHFLFCSITLSCGFQWYIVDFSIFFLFNFDAFVKEFIIFKTSFSFTIKESLNIWTTL